MESPDGWKFTRRLCGKDHEVPEEVAPYWTEEQGALKRVLAGEVALGCSENSGRTAQYTFTDFSPYRVEVRQ